MTSFSYLTILKHTVKCATLEQYPNGEIRGEITTVNATDWWT